MTRPEAVMLFSDLLNAREQLEHGDFVYDHLEDLCDAAILAVADICSCTAEQEMKEFVSSI